MLRRLDWIRDSGLFQNFKWDAATPEFARVNVIYGANGSGKTSLSRALGIQEAEDDRHKNISVTVESGGTSLQTNGSRNAVFDRVYVFSEEYVGRAHRLRTSDPTMDSILTLGKRTADAEDRLMTLLAEVDVDVKSLGALAKKAEQVKKRRDAEVERVSNDVVTELRSLGGRWASRSNYHVGIVQAKYAGDRSKWAKLSDGDLEKDKRLIASPAMDEVPPLRDGKLEVREGLSGEAEAVLKKTPVTIVLDTLREHPEATNWVQAGQSLHAESDTCIYCGSPLTDKRKRDIEHHFAGEVASLQSQIDNLVAELGALKDELGTFESTVPKKAELYPDLGEDFQTAKTTLTSQKAKFEAWIEGLSKRLSAKRANVLAAVDRTDVEDPPSVELDALAKLVAKHNEQVNDRASVLQKAGARVESHILKTSEQAVDESAEALKTAKRDVDLATEALQAKRDEITSLGDVEGDPLPSAEVLTREVGRLLGRTELTFEAVDKRYRVLRDGQPAVGLSVGEQTAITLVAFMERVARADHGGEMPIVVVDDPVSSLDSNVFMGVSTYIWDECLAKENVGQLLLLTHNFELFRQWDVQFDFLRGRQDMSARFPTRTYELKTKHTSVGGRIRRTPAISSWPPSEAVRKKVRSSYQHSFLGVVEAYLAIKDSDALERRLDAQLLFPNAMRRMLETFVGFKRPDLIGNFTEAMRQCKTMLEEAGYDGDASAIRQHLTRYLHAYSHDESPDTTATINPDEIETAMRSIFIFMNALDATHFDGLCAVAGVKSSLLVA